MAAPKEVNIDNLSGRWLLDRELSDDLEPVLKIQGVPFLVRKVMLVATITETIEEKVNADGVRGLIITKGAVGLKGSSDLFDGTGKETMMGGGGYFGDAAAVHSWWADLNDESRLLHPGTKKPLDPYLLDGWLSETQAGRPGHFAACGSKKDFNDDMFWGFCDVGGKRYRVVRYSIRKGDEVVRARMVYGWLGRE